MVETVTIGDTEVEIRETEDGFEAVEVPDDDLPKFGAYQMQEQVDITSSFDFYVDGDGDVWIDYDGFETTAIVGYEWRRLEETRAKYR